MDGGLSHRQSSHKEDQSAAEPETLGAARGSSAAAALKTARRSSEQPAARRRVEAPPGQRTLGAARGGAAARSHRVRRAVNVTGSGCSALAERQCWFDSTSVAAVWRRGARHRAPPSGWLGLVLCAALPAEGSSIGVVPVHPLNINAGHDSSARPRDRGGGG